MTLRKLFLFAAPVAAFFIGMFMLATLASAQVWTPPSQSFPGGQAMPPIHEGLPSQQKAGPNNSTSVFNFSGANRASFRTDYLWSKLGQVVEGKVVADEFCFRDSSLQLSPFGTQLLSPLNDCITSWPTGALPTGTTAQTLRWNNANGGAWEANDGLQNSGGRVRIHNPQANPGLAGNQISATLDLVGTFRFRGDGLTTPSAGQVLTSDAGGVATWQDPTGGAITSGPEHYTLRSDGPPAGAAVWSGLMQNDATTISIKRNAEDCSILEGEEGGLQTGFLDILVPKSAFAQLFSACSSPYLFDARVNVSGSQRGLVVDGAGTTAADRLVVYEKSKLIGEVTIGSGSNQLRIDNNHVRDSITFEANVEALGETHLSRTVITNGNKLSGWDSDFEWGGSAGEFEIGTDADFGADVTVNQLVHGAAQPLQVCADNNGKLILCATNHGVQVYNASFSSGTQVVNTTSGTLGSANPTVFTMPTNVSGPVIIEVWGAGGGGGRGHADAGTGGGGGAAGHYVKKTVNLQAGQQYQVSVGRAGYAGHSSSTSGQAGQPSSFGSGLVSAKGGSGGGAGLLNNPGFGGGAGGNGSNNGDVIQQGSAGQNGGLGAGCNYASVSGSARRRGGAGASAPLGGSGGDGGHCNTWNGAPGQPGGVPGAGGGGGSGGGHDNNIFLDPESGNGSIGGFGQVRISW